jgi:hypothetical protein
MKSVLKILVPAALLLFTSCEKDEGKLPNISFKTGGSYISGDASIAGGTTILMGIDASKAEDRDVLKKFNISRSVNGGAEASLQDKSLSSSEEDNFSTDFSFKLDTTKGQTNKFIYTITNRDGLTNQVALTVTVK